MSRLSPEYPDHAALRHARGWWQEPEKWPPFDPPTAIFLGRLVDKVGRARYGEGWRPADPFLVTVDATGRPTKVDPAKLPPALKPLADTLQEARADLAVKYEQWATVIWDIAQGVVAGKISYALRWPDGTCRPEPATSWNRDDWLTLFRKCQMQPPGAWRGSYLLPIYVLEAEADYLLGGREAGEHPDWWAEDGVRLKEWVSRPAVVAEARRRVNLANPVFAEKRLYPAMRTMWMQSGRPGGTEGSIEQAYRAGKGG